MTSAGTTAALDDPVGETLAGRHARFALAAGRVRRYAPEVAPFFAMPPDETPDDWEQAAELAGDGGVVTLIGPEPVAPEGWTLRRRMEGLQMASGSALGEPDPELVALGAADVPEMLELVARTQPGPFATRTVELGGYLGLRVDGELVAMAGRRLSLPGWTELSAVCTAPEQRGRGLASRTMRAVAASIEADGDRAFLHVRADNTSAIALYERLGFYARREIVISLIARR